MSELRLKRRGQHGQNKTEQPDHYASPGDSIAVVLAQTRDHHAHLGHDRRAITLRGSGLPMDWYQSCASGTVSMLSMSIHGVRMFIERIFSRGRHGQESKEGKENCEGSHQEGGKEDIQEKEVIWSTTNRVPLPGPEASENSPKDLNSRLRPSKCRGTTWQGRTFVQTAARSSGFCLDLTHSPNRSADPQVGVQLLSALLPNEDHENAQR